MSTSVRPTKKQRELLNFIEDFIAEHGYSPSYREIMVGLQYTSVATVALHVNSLIKRGHLYKRDGKARSLEVTRPQQPQPPQSSIQDIQPSQEKWLVERIERMFQDLEAAVHIAQAHLDKLYVMVGALRVLGLEGAAQSFIPRLSSLKQRTVKPADAENV